MYFISFLNFSIKAKKVQHIPDRSKVDQSSSQCTESRRCQLQQGKWCQGDTKTCQWLDQNPPALNSCFAAQTVLQHLYSQVIQDCTKQAIKISLLLLPTIVCPVLNRMFMKETERADSTYKHTLTHSFIYGNEEN